MTTAKDTDQKFRALFHNSLDALLIIDDEEGTILETNAAAKNLLRYEHDRLMGQPFISLLPPLPEHATQATIEEIKTFGAVFVQEFIRADGSTLVMDMTLTMIPWGSGSAILATLRDVSERVRYEEERERLINELQVALEKIKTLKGLLPICAHCKKIRNDDGYWQQIEVYIHEHSEADFTHGICPDCMKELYPDFYEDDGET